MNRTHRAPKKAEPKHKPVTDVDARHPARIEAENYDVVQVWTMKRGDTLELNCRLRHKVTGKYTCFVAKPEPLENTVFNQENKTKP